MITVVRFIGGPFDGLMQGWHTEGDLPESLRMSNDLAQMRGGMKREVTMPESSGCLVEGEEAADVVIYRRRDIGIYYFDAIPDDFGADPVVGSA